jgi:wyosine [tRNA(Phe)-imidazoG37] synthetase (radical SAM superfamily)
VIEELKETGVDRISVSLNAHNKETYNYVCKPRFQNAYENVIKFIEKAKNPVRHRNHNRDHTRSRYRGDKEDGDREGNQI